MLVVPMMAAVFGGKESTGMILPMLIIGDIIAVWYYNQHADWGNIKRLMPWTVVGLILGLGIGRLINDAQFKMLIAVIVLICLLILVYTEKKGDRLKVPQKLWIYATTGILAGFATMIGNAAGPIFTIYLLAMDLKKEGFMGTAAWFFFIVNLIKLPLQFLVWHNIPVKSFLLTGSMLPFIALGAFLGIVILKRINEILFRYVLLAMTAIATLRLFM